MPRSTLLGCLAMATLAGGCVGLSDVDRKVNRTVAERSEALDTQSPAPRLDMPDPATAAVPGQTDPTPLTTNPAAADLPFNAADESRDVEARLRDLMDESLLGPVPEPPLAGVEALRIGLPDAFQISQITARDFLNAEEDYLLAAISLLIERHRWDPRLFNDTSFNISGEATDGSYENTARLINDLRLTQRLPYGGEVAASWIWQASEQLREASTEDYRQSSEIALDATIPLLRGAGMTARESRIQAERNLVYAARDFERFRRQFLVDIASDYFDLLQAQASIRNEERRLLSAIGLEEQQQARFEAGEVAQFQVNIARTDVLSARASLVNRREAYAIALDRFKVRLGIPVEQPVDVLPFTFAVPEPDIELQEATRRGLEYRLDLQNTRDRVEDRRRAVANAENNTLPDLDINGRVGIPTDPDRDVGSVSFDPEELEYAAGINLSLPLDREIERLGVRQAQINLQRQMRTYDQARDNVVVDVRRAVRAVEIARYQLKLAEESVRISELRLEEQRLKLDEVDAQEIVDTNNAKLDAENRRDQAVTNLRNAVLNYLLDSGQMRVQRDGTFQALPGMERREMTPVDPQAP
ncbi:MAG: TolC family protein [Phycisphaerales bacterium JB039]